MQKAVEIKSQGRILRGMLHVPEGIVGRIPVVTIFHGFTGNKIEPHFIFVKLSRRLERQGIASVRFDFGGSGESDGDFSDMTLSGEVLEAADILDYAKSLDFADSGRIGVMGLSMGGAVASILAGERKEDVKALCLWAPAGNMGELVMSRMLAVDEPGVMDRIRKKGYVDFGGLMLGVGFIDDVTSLDIYQKASPYDRNVLIIHGNNDQTVPLSVSRRYLEIYGGRAELYVVNGGDHTFSSLRWEEDVLTRTVDFFMKELA